MPAKNSELRYYNVKKHETVIIVSMILVFAVIILAVPWLIAAIEWMFRQIPCWAEDATEGQLNVGVLPDFLGGAVGILAGFVMEWKFFNQLKLIEKYKTLVVLLEDEFKRILLELYRQEDEDLEYYQRIKEMISNDIILSTENNSVIYNLPKFSRHEKGRIYKLLLEIYRDIDHYNMLVDKNDSDNAEIEKDINDIKEGIRLFAIVAGLDDIKQMIAAREEINES
ncbi:TPA: hypothetical protein IAC10_14530 [Candidatus Scatousia excrementigallinarum]|uniref:Uncharacterized protein n=1 Tax=Candidatus Scatousia excrementigallinarum TaxID=2840935 RepID=A0A9D1JP87_9BACT|nr:hypothetical protein [Candidatus Scatousia excrementigallinarum]